MQVKCLAQGYSATPREPRPIPKTSQSKVAAHSHHATRPCMYMEYNYILDVGTLKVVTARELVVFSGSVTFHSLSMRRHRHLRGHASHERYTVSSVEGRQTNLHKPIPRAAGIEPGMARRLLLRY